MSCCGDEKPAWRVEIYPSRGHHETPMGRVVYFRVKPFSLSIGFGVALLFSTLQTPETPQSLRILVTRRDESSRATRVARAKHHRRHHTRRGCGVGQDEHHIGCEPRCESVNKAGLMMYASLSWPPNGSLWPEWKRMSRWVETVARWMCTELHGGVVAGARHTIRCTPLDVCDSWAALNLELRPWELSMIFPFG